MKTLLQSTTYWTTSVASRLYVPTRACSHLSHVDKDNRPTMVDVSNKNPTKRTAHAQCMVQLSPEVSILFDRKDIQAPKGPVFATAIIAGTMGAKKTSELIPFCHPLPIESCKVEIDFKDGLVVINCTVSVHSKTGVEMEALTGATVAALTVYDMCKGLSHNIVIKEAKLVTKTGGKSDYVAKTD